LSFTADRGTSARGPPLLKGSSNANISRQKGRVKGFGKVGAEREMRGAPRELEENGRG